MLFGILLASAAAATPLAWLSGYLLGYSCGPRTRSALTLIPRTSFRRVREHAAQALILLLIADNLRLKLLSEQSMAGLFLEFLIVAVWLVWVLLYGVTWGLRRWHTGEAT